MIEHHEALHQTAEHIVKHTNPIVAIVSVIIAWLFVGMSYFLDIASWHVPQFYIDLLRILSLLLACAASIFAIIASRKSIKNKQ